MKLFALVQLLLWSLALAAQQPNILFILTDDQGKYMGGLEHMSHLQETLVQNGTTYSKHFCSTALCCPSRANLWTGRMPHNTNVTNVNPPYGGYPKVVSAGWNDNYLPIWMQEAGYDTYYVGKLWNAHTLQNYNKPFAKGFNYSDFLLDPWTYRYYAARMTRNGRKPVDYSGRYSTDVLAEKSLGFLDQALKNPRPWMLTVAPNAPHSNGSSNPAQKVHWFGEPEYAPRHANMFKNYKVPRAESFNTVIEGAVGWVGKLSQLSQKEINYIDEFQRCRLRALQAVDEMVGRLVSHLDEAGVLDNTYIFYTTDNGYHLGQHAMQPGKNCGYDTDINVPLIVRGPGVPQNNSVTDMVTSHTDIAPTLLSLAGTTRNGLDGRPISLTAKATSANRSSEHVAIEYWGRGVPEGIYGYMSNKTHHAGNSFRNNTYKGIRLISNDYSLYYSIWCSNEVEFYILKDDPLQTINMAADRSKYDSYSIAGQPLEQILLRLNTLMMVLKSCSGDSCREPWRQLHPDGDVNTLAEALDTRYNDFYSSQPKVSFSECILGYQIWAEGPQEFNIFGRNADDDSSKQFLPDTITLVTTASMAMYILFRGIWR